MNIFLLVLFVYVCNVFGQECDCPKTQIIQRKQMKGLYQTGFDFCDVLTYYFTNNSTHFCQSDGIAQFIIGIGITAYIILWIMFGWVTIFLFFNYDKF